MYCIVTDGELGRGEIFASPTLLNGEMIKSAEGGIVNTEEMLA
jgi:hypothetical protein